MSRLQSSISFIIGKEHMTLGLVPIHMVFFQLNFSILPFQAEGSVFYQVSSIVKCLWVYGHFASKTLSSSTRQSGEAPRSPNSSSQTPVFTTYRPVFDVSAFRTSGSFVTPHCTAFTRDKSQSPRSHLRREGITCLAFKTHPKLLAVSQSFLIICQEGLSLCPAVSWLTSLIVDQSSLVLSIKY